MTNILNSNKIDTSAYVTHTNTISPLPNLEVLPIEGQRAADQCVKYHPQAPDIHLRPVVLLALKELRGSVGRGAAECVQLVPQSELITEAKVSYFDVHVCIQQQVLRLQTQETQAWGIEEKKYDREQKNVKKNKEKMIFFFYTTSLRKNLGKKHSCELWRALDHQL